MGSVARVPTDRSIHRVEHQLTGLSTSSTGRQNKPSQHDVNEFGLHLGEENRLQGWIAILLELMPSNRLRTGPSLRNFRARPGAEHPANEIEQELRG